jgi:hypothetical protein
LPVPLLGNSSKMHASEVNLHTALRAIYRFARFFPWACNASVHFAADAAAADADAAAVHFAAAPQRPCILLILSHGASCSLPFFCGKKARAPAVKRFS